jgi:hypothetical protein
MHWLLASCLASLLALSATAAAAPASGKLRVITYNVAGLPEGISASRPATNSPLIGERLNRYDLVLVQEDFAYGRELRARVRLPYQSRAFERGERYDFGDGLSIFSRFPCAELERTPWTACHGITGDYFDCLTPKGFTLTTLTLGDDIVLDVYDAHLDAGSSDGEVPFCTSETSSGTYFRWLQLPALIVRFLFMALPMGKLVAVSGYTPTMTSVPALASESTAQSKTCEGASPTIQFFPSGWRSGASFSTSC